MTTKEPEFDRSGKPVLFHVKGIFAGVPDTDLSTLQLARIAWINAGPGRPSRPEDVKPSAIAALRDELIASGKYAAKPPKESSDV